MNITAFDIVLLLVIFFFIIKVTLSGFVAEFFSKAAVVLGGISAVVFYHSLSTHIEPIIGPHAYPGLVSFLIIFLVVYLLVKIIQRIVGSAFQGDSMVNLDRSLGFFLGIAEGLLVVALIIIILNDQPWFNITNLTEGSFFYRIFRPFAFSSTALIPVLIPGY